MEAHDGRIWVLSAERDEELHVALPRWASLDSSNAGRLYPARSMNSEKHETDSGRRYLGPSSTTVNPACLTQLHERAQRELASCGRAAFPPAPPDAESRAESGGSVEQMGSSASRDEALADLHMLRVFVQELRRDDDFSGMSALFGWHDDWIPRRS